MAIELFGTAELQEILRNDRLATQDNFWSDMFPRVIQSTTEKIIFDDLPDDRRLAPFVAPNVQGRVMKDRGSSARSFRPAYVKPKHAVDPSRAIPRRAGESFMGSLSLDARFNAIVADNLRMERESIERRWDWMACRAVVDGLVTVVGEDYPSQTVDFLRHADLTETLAGAARWGEAGINPLTDISEKNTRAFQLSNAPIGRLVFGLSAWALFIANSSVLALLNTQVRGSESQMSTVPLSGAPFERQGTIVGTGGMGRLELFTYSNTYDDSTFTAVDYIDTHDVIGIGGAMNGVRMFGAIMDTGARLQPLPMFSKMWNQEDPSVTFTMTQSAPLMVPLKSNNTWKLKVR